MDSYAIPAFADILIYRRKERRKEKKIEDERENDEWPVVIDRRQYACEASLPFALWPSAALRKLLHTRICAFMQTRKSPTVHAAAAAAAAAATVDP